MSAGYYSDGNGGVMAGKREVDDSGMGKEGDSMLLDG
jgi:hypothetical protein